jgi:anti-sigma factor RsiW
MADRLVAGSRCSELSDLAPAFVLGALAPAEMASVRAHLAECPEAHAEFEELGSVLPALLASVHQVEPSDALLGRILAAARADQANRTRAGTPAAPPARDISSAPSLLDRLGLGSSRSRPAWAALGIAAVLAVVVLGSLDLQLQASNRELAAYQQGVAAVIDAASRPGAQVAVLAASSPSSPAAGIAAVRADGTVAIAMRGLAPTSGSQVYEAWLVAGNSAPVPIGGFPVGGSGSGTLLATNATPTPGEVVALTLEPGPGATSPTLPLIASGAAQARPG